MQIEVATISPARSNKSSKGIHWQKKANQKYIQTFKIKADNFLEKSSKFKLDFVSKREWTPILGTTIRAIYPIGPISLRKAYFGALGMGQDMLEWCSNFMSTHILTEIKFHC